MSGVTQADRDDFMQVNIEDVNAALSHLGFDNMEDFHQWALDENELKRFDQLCLLLTRHRQAAYAAGRDAERERAKPLWNFLEHTERCDAYQTRSNAYPAECSCGLVKIRAAIAAATEGGAG